jgi:GTP-binding protein
MDQEEMTDTATPQQIEAARVLFAGPCDFVAGSETLDRIPDCTLPEFGFVGRSNVGKSSLVNALTSRKTLARVSHTPGRTQQLNFFNLGDKLLLVDMPGYGFAKVAKGQSNAWNKLIRTYLRGRPTLRCVFVLVDARHGLKESDLDVMKLLDEAAVSYRIVLTKSDEVKIGELAQVVEATQATLAKHAAAYPLVQPTSSQNGQGIPELRAAVYGLV